MTTVPNRCDASPEMVHCIVSWNEVESEPVEAVMVTLPEFGGAVYVVLAMPVLSVVAGFTEKLPPAPPAQ